MNFHFIAGAGQGARSFYMEQTPIEPDTSIEGESPKVTQYEFKAFCTSDECRLSSPKSKDRTDIGIIKQVKRTVDECPDCGYYLFWDRRVSK